jgi:hypothetical protein
MVLASGCGSGGHRGTRAEAIAFAGGVNLRAGEFTENVSSEGAPEPDGAVVRFEVTPPRGCGPSYRGERFDFYSPVFRPSARARRVRLAGGHLSLPAEGFHSKVSVMKSAGEAQRDFSANACAARAAAEAHHAQLLPGPALPMVRLLGLRTWRTAPSYMFERTDVRLYSDGFRFVMGAAEVKLAVTSAPRPPRAELERHLLSVLYNEANLGSPLLAGEKLPVGAVTG